jgi:hypothetical protein
MNTTKKIDGIMSENIEIKRDAHSFKIFGMMLPALPSLIFRLGRTFLKFKRNTKTAGKVFKKELIKQGFNKETAEGLTKIYLEGSDISKYILSFK